MKLTGSTRAKVTMPSRILIRPRLRATITPKRPAAMLDAPVVWVVLAPLVGGMVAALLLVLQNREYVQPRFVPWLRLAALVSVVAGLVAEVVLLLTVEGSITLDTLGFSLAISTPA